MEGIGTLALDVASLACPNAQIALRATGKLTKTSEILEVHQPPAHVVEPGETEGALYVRYGTQPLGEVIGYFACRSTGRGQGIGSTSRGTKPNLRVRSDRCCITGL